MAMVELSDSLRSQLRGGIERKASFTLDAPEEPRLFRQNGGTGWLVREATWEKRNAIPTAPENCCGELL